MNILIVDDEMTVLKTVYSQLLGMGLKAGRIDTANSAREAKERISDPSVRYRYAGNGRDHVCKMGVGELPGY